MSAANEIQVGGAHYRSDFQHWDMCAAYFGAGYFQGNATKYLARWRNKNGVQDLQKARHYVVKLIELLEAGVVKLQHPRGLDRSAMQFCLVNKLPPADCVIVMCVAEALDISMLHEALHGIDELISQANHTAHTRGNDA